MSTVIDFPSRRVAAQQPAAEAPRLRRDGRSPASPERAAKTAAKSRISLDANKTAQEVWLLSYEVGDLKKRIATLLDEYDAKLKVVTSRVGNTLQKLRDEAHVNIENGERPA